MQAPRQHLRNTPEAGPPPGPRNPSEVHSSPHGTSFQGLLGSGVRQPCGCPRWDGGSSDVARPEWGEKAEGAPSDRCSSPPATPGANSQHNPIVQAWRVRGTWATAASGYPAGLPKPTATLGSHLRGQGSAAERPEASSVSKDIHGRSSQRPSNNHSGAMLPHLLSFGV